jgi:hypothetical protein
MMKQVKEYHQRGKAQYTVDLLVKVDGFIKKVNNIFNIERN